MPSEHSSARAPQTASSSSNQIWLFFAAILLMGVASRTQESIFSNFLADTFNITAGGRGWLELPRELPGFLVVLVAGALAALPVTRLGMTGAAIMACGILGIALLGVTSFGLMVVFMVIASTGMHLAMPVASSLAIGLGGKHDRGKRMGEADAVGTLGMILGSAFIWVIFDKTSPQYRTGFTCAALVAMLAAIVYRQMHVPHLHQPRARLVFRRKYRLYYVLEFFHGARKQIFLTFGPWVLIKVYGFQAETMAGLFTLSALAGLVFKPLAGRVIDRIGERGVLVADGIVLVLVCVGYGYALQITGDMEKARKLACACFILDDMLFALGSGRAIYVSRLVHSPQELTSTLAMGVSINHIVSMSIPAVAGAIWLGFGYQRVFLSGACLAVVISCLASLIPPKPRTGALPRKRTSRTTGTKRI